MEYSKYHEWHQGPAKWVGIQSIHYAWSVRQVLKVAILLCNTRRKLGLREGKETSILVNTALYSPRHDENCPKSHK